ncbi:outer membrane beta-barrel protein [Flavihumibacter sp. CACIAM 22H1]|uniref:outer membrane beta-barrel protein n=1 Tax=Flavihumibacter sp. CACIAM 22H1 TaxID=1812911 RepID=UPI0007A7D0A2|nr:outer membrane beta-barrel protein [Flavihumibacter sp. CACIAM 22H1]KYP13886.1 MAG: hypothetical protein A1D16_20715 [Flavihumibacter sp. CACIAM 22H1]
MRKLTAILSAILLTLAAQAQTDSSAASVTEPASKASEKVAKPKKDWSKVKLANRANDHFMIQMGYDTWSQVPDSIRLKGIGRHLNIYLMMDFPFKVDPRFSVGIGVGIGSSNVFFDKHKVDIAGTSQTLAFQNLADTNHFKKYKLVNVWAEVPVELRFAANPENTNKSWKFALGAKVGTMLNAHTKGKNWQNKSGNTLNNYVEKINSKRYFNSLRLAATARISYGPFGIYGAYQINTLIKDNQGPPVHPVSVGLTISGL